jgi:hypothetical protein
LCLYSELRPGEEHFYTFDPLKGQAQEVPALTIRDSNYYSFNWSLSPDGKLLAFSKKLGIQDQPAIRLLSLSDAKEHFISLPGWTGTATLIGQRMARACGRQRSTRPKQPLTCGRPGSMQPGNGLF